MTNKFQKNTAGFTLIETMIAVLLLATAIAGPLTIASKGITTTMVAKDQFIAFYLAQDAIEQIRFMRDSACLTGPVSSSGDCDAAIWTSTLAACTGATGCYFDSLRTDITPPTACDASAGCPIMKYDSALLSYRYATGIQSPQRFIRTVKIGPNPSGTFADQATVTVTVAWTDIAGVTHAPITARETIFRWQ